MFRIKVKTLNLKIMKRLFVALVLMISFMAAAGQAIHVEKKGKGPAVLFLPGFTSPGSVWNETITNLKGSYESHVVSYAGFNGLKPIGTPWYESIRNELIEYIGQENISDIIVIGHSMGGNLAVDIAAALPDKVSDLVLVESIPCMLELMMPGVPASSLQYDSPYNQQVLAMNDDALRQMAGQMSQNMTLDASKAVMLTQWAVEADRKTYVYGYTDLLKLDLRDKLKSVHSKTLILGSAFPDKNLVQGNYEKQYANLASKEIRIVDNSRHFIMFDQPQWLYDNINTFLDQK